MCVCVVVVVEFLTNGASTPQHIQKTMSPVPPFGDVGVCVCVCCCCCCNHYIVPSTNGAHLATTGYVAPSTNNVQIMFQRS